MSDSGSPPTCLMQERFRVIGNMVMIDAIKRERKNISSIVSKTVRRGGMRVAVYI